MNTLRAYLGTDTPLTLWVRDDAGKRVLSNFDSLEVLLYPYGWSTDIGLVLTAANPETGKVTFTLTQAAADAYLCAGSYRYVLKGTDGSDTETLASGLLEVV